MSSLNHLIDVKISVWRKTSSRISTISITDLDHKVWNFLTLHQLPHHVFQILYIDFRQRRQFKQLDVWGVIDLDVIIMGHSLTDVDDLIDVLLFRDIPDLDHFLHLIY